MCVDLIASLQEQWIAQRIGICGSGTGRLLAGPGERPSIRSISLAKSCSMNSIAALIRAVFLSSGCVSNQSPALNSEISGMTRTRSGQGDRSNRGAFTGAREESTGDRSAYADSLSDPLLLRACDEIHAHQKISDQTYDALSAELSEAQIVELIFVIGNYTMLSMVANATGVPLEERLPAMPEKSA